MARNANYDVREEFGDLPEGSRVVDLSKDGRGKPAARQDSEFDDLDRGTFRADRVDESARGLQEPDEEDPELDDEDPEVDTNQDPDDEDELEQRQQRRDARDSATDQSMRKRLARERRLRQESDEEADFYRQRTETLERRIASVETKLTSGETTQVLETEASALAIKQQNVKRELKIAKEAGDVDKEIELTEELGRITGDLQVNKFKTEEAKKASKAATEAATTAGKAPNRHAQKWMRQHGPWYSNPNNAAMAAAVEREVLATGSNPHTAEHFARVDAKLSKLFPKEFKRSRTDGRTLRSPVNGGGDDDTRTAQRRPAAGSIDIQVRNGRAIITPDHERIMREFGLDPDSPDDVNSFVKENVRKARR